MTVATSDPSLLSAREVTESPAGADNVIASTDDTPEIVAPAAEIDGDAASLLTHAMVVPSPENATTLRLPGSVARCWCTRSTSAPSLPFGSATYAAVPFSESTTS